VSEDGGRIVGSNLLALALLAGGWPAYGLDRSVGGGGVERLAGETVGTAAVGGASELMIC